MKLSGPESSGRNPDEHAIAAAHWLLPDDARAPVEEREDIVEGHNLNLHGPGTLARRGLAADAASALRHWSTFLFLFAALTAAFVALIALNPDLVGRLVAEDGAVENATSFLLFAASLLFAATAWQPGPQRSARLFCAAAAALLFVAGMEQISWGQRLLDIRTPEFFLEHSDQPEISLHNTFQQWSGLTTKQVVGTGFVVYGAVLPWLLHAGTISPRGLVRHLVVPPLFLSPAVVLGALFMIDRPTGSEEEVGELLLALWLLIFARHVHASTTR